MLKRPLNPRFREPVLRDVKTTTIRNKVWPVGARASGVGEGSFFSERKSSATPGRADAKSMTTENATGVIAPLESQGPIPGVAAVAAGSARFVWCAEAPNFPGYYAAKEPVMHGKLGEKGTELGTYNFWGAYHFATKSECEAWIAKNSPPAWKPTDHGIG